MGWIVKHVQDHPTGRKSFRRQFPSHLRPYLSGSQLRVSLGWPDSPDFLSRYDSAAKQWDAAVALAERKHAGAYDRLDAPTIAGLAEAFRIEALAADEAARWSPEEREVHSAVAVQLEVIGGFLPWKGAERSRWAIKARASLEGSMEQWQSMKANGDLEGIVEWWAEEVADIAEARGLVIDPSDAEGIAALCRAVNDAAISSGKDRMKRMEGEEVLTPPEAETIQKAAHAPSRSRKGAVPLIATYEAYAAAQGISEGVKREWRSYVENLKDFVGHDDASRLTADNIMEWRDHLLVTPTRYGKPRKPVTVRDKYITSVRCTLAWAVDEKKLSENVAAAVKVRIPKETKVRDKDFTMEEALAILRASTKPPSGRLSAPYVRARRWIPWLCAYSGARVNELSQLRKGDIQEVEGVWCMNITPEAGTVKTQEARQVPLHPHVIEQGFLEVVKALEDGPIFYDPKGQRATGEATKGNRHFKKVGEKLGQWVRQDVGITDPAIKPNHAWRHLFKTLSADAGIQERVADAIQGHAPATTGRKYGKISVTAKAAAIRDFPRFTVQ